MYCVKYSIREKGVFSVDPCMTDQGPFQALFYFRQLWFPSKRQWHKFFGMSLNFLQLESLASQLYLLDNKKHIY
jgi:hypothetical protein